MGECSVPSELSEEVKKKALEMYSRSFGISPNFDLNLDCFNAMNFLYILVGTGTSVALIGFQFNHDFAEVPRALHESIGFFGLIELEHTVYNRMNFI